MKQVKKFLEKAEKIAQLQWKQSENRCSLATQIPPIFILSYAEFEQKYGSNLYLNSDFDVLVFDGNLSLSQSMLNSRWLAEQFEQTGSNNDRQAMFVNGDLLINGDIIDDDYLFLQVAKDVVCHYLHSANGNIVIGGSLTALQGISGEYNDGMLQVLGKTQAPYIVSNDHSMPGSSATECIYIQNGQVGCSYHGTLEGWEFFENSELMFKDGIYEGDYQINISAFFELIKKGVNPLVDFETFEANKAAWDEEQDEGDDNFTESQSEDETLEQLLYLPDLGRNDDELYRFVVAKHDEIQKITDDTQKYGQNFFDLSIILGSMVSHWRIVSQRYDSNKRERVRLICITLGNDWGRYLLQNSKDTRMLQFAYDFLQEALNLEQNEPFIYETIVRLGLALQKFEEVYPLVRAIDKNMLDIANKINDVIASEAYQAWLAKQ